MGSRLQSLPGAGKERMEPDVAAVASEKVLLLLAAKISESEGKVGVTSKRVARAWRGKLKPRENADISETRSWAVASVSLGAWGQPGMEFVPPGALIAISYRPTISIDRTTT